MQYQVRCCCEPTKLYGLLELPDGLYSGSETTVYERPSLRASFRAEPSAQVTVESPRHRIKLQRVFDARSGLDEIAVYSDDRPIEFWRRIQGFTELRPQDFTLHTIDMSVVEECSYALGRGGNIKVYVETAGADRLVCGRVKAVRYIEGRGWTDITVEEMVPVQR